MGLLYVIFSDDYYLLKKISMYEFFVGFILDPHHVWRSLDPTLDISSNFVTI